ncbi:hypothetical protein BL250_15470 [Erwinia sp. OLTSP20]|uniref:YcgJ family protein n=1 Tax=unclassified Erwinia TaxID=2622719 RepID=UPI000C18979D|nr:MULTISPECIES: YcgJ family protein [unclassified Erwinia]PIJ48607.1 hypothetical protein BV501_16490 [Erwinia sp. OAMSP11]PIJ68961.1 hypothetical protein BK416_15730 [Erwinia sp. OLSSP12]PIJ78825.1 hypothetical protein BLD47_16525 [Erwinia sp. OLCASP19]PIJ79925.1 hypothetical protein BLD46_16380 [Erwinia sp. OLMTSP26]PIJ82043.1 hypothetical protein BLD49_15895 [Erwinia sp. OLMDSP33]
MKTFSVLLLLAFVLPTANAAERSALRSPATGVVCDAYLCADASGVSAKLTRLWLGKRAGERLIAQGEFDHSAFTFANGVYCDVKTRSCRKDRYFGADGQPSGALDIRTTRLLFGH